MGLALRKDSKWWYARYEVHGKEVVKNLRVEVRGTRPATLRELGSAHFENSRGEAQSAFDRLMVEIDSGRTNEQLAQAVYEARTGAQVSRYDLKDLPSIWLDRPRKRPPSEKHRDDYMSMLKRFVDFVHDLDPRVVKVDQLRVDHVRAYLADLEEQGMTAARWNKYLDLIKSVFHRCGVTVADDFINKETETVFREPYSVEDLQAIFAAARESDSVIHSIAVTAACTAMRRKDCCFLKWDDIDFAEGFITVKTSKTGVTVDIPMADMLRDEIEAHMGLDPVFVFPKARLQYLADDTALSKRFRAVLRLAGFDDGKGPRTELRTDEFEPEQLEAEAERIFSSPKLERVLQVLAVYLSGKSIKATATALHVSAGSVSSYLNDLENESGIKFLRGKRRSVETPKKESRGQMTRPREHGQLVASIRDFHSFRTTFITLAMSNGMPIDTVRLITGHRTVEIVTKHYFRPQREEIRKAMQATLPGLLTSAGAVSAEPLQKVRELLESMTSENWEVVRGAALKLLYVA